ncbi:YncE family protein [Thalassiella azotivora]
MSVPHPRRVAAAVLLAVAVTTSCAPSSGWSGSSGSTGFERRDGVVDPASGPAVAPTDVTGAVWVADEDGDSLTVLDAATGATVTTVTGVEAPHNVQASADGTAVWALSGAGRVIRLDAGDGSLVRGNGTSAHPAHVVERPGGLLVTASGEPSVVAYDERERPVSRTDLPGAPHGLRVSADGTTALVANTGAGTLEVLDVASGTVRRSVPVGPGPVQTAVSDDGSVGWASVSGTSEVVRVDLRTGEVTHRATVTAAPAQVYLTSRGHLLVADEGTQEAPGRVLSVLDAATLAAVAQVPTGAGPHGVVADPTGRWAWVTNTDDATVTVVDLTAMRAVGTVDVGAGPGGISLSTTTVGAGVPDTVRLDLPGVHSHEDDHGDDGHGDDH